MCSLCRATPRLELFDPAKSDVSVLAGLRGRLWGRMRDTRTPTWGADGGNGSVVPMNKDLRTDDQLQAVNYQLGYVLTMVEERYGMEYADDLREGAEVSWLRYRDSRLV